MADSARVKPRLGGSRAESPVPVRQDSDLVSGPGTLKEAFTPHQQVIVTNGLFVHDTELSYRARPVCSDILR